MARPFSDVLGPSLAPPIIPAQAMSQDFTERTRVVETEDTALPALVRTSKTSERPPQGAMNLTEATPSLGPHVQGLDPLETMFTPGASMVYYRHYHSTDTGAI